MSESVDGYILWDARGRFHIYAKEERTARVLYGSPIRSCTVVALRGNAVCCSSLLRVMRSDDYDDDARKCASAGLLKS